MSGLSYTQREAVLRGSAEAWQGKRENGTEGSTQASLERRGLAEVRYTARPHKRLVYRLNPAGLELQKELRGKRARSYAVLIGDSSESWIEHDAGRSRSRDAAIHVARRLLAYGDARAAAVQGRGTPDWPTPPSEVSVWRGIAEGYSTAALFGPLDPVEVEVVARRQRLQLGRPLRDRAA